MKQYIYFEDKTEYIIHGNKVENYPVGKLMFSLLDTDWIALEAQAEAVRKEMQSSEEKPYFLVAALYQRQREVLQEIHPYLYQLVDAYLNDVIENLYQEEWPAAHDFALRLFKKYPEAPMTPEAFHEFMYGTEPVLPDQPLKDVAASFMEAIVRLYHDLTQYSANLKDMIEFSLDDAGMHSSLSSKQRFYLMQISEYAPFVGSKKLYENIGIERRILEDTELDYGRYEEVTPELIQQVQNYALNAYTFYYSTDIRVLVFMEFEFMCTNDLTVRKCENCGRYFLPFSKVSLFCDRLVEDSDKTCKEIGALIKHNQKVNADKSRSLFRRLNNAYQMRCSRAPEGYKEKMHAQYEEWKKNARTLLKQVEEGVLTVEKFEELVRL